MPLLIKKTIGMIASAGHFTSAAVTVAMLPALSCKGLNLLSSCLFNAACSAILYRWKAEIDRNSPSEWILYACDPKRDGLRACWRNVSRRGAFTCKSCGQELIVGQNKVHIRNLRAILPTFRTCAFQILDFEKYCPPYWTAWPLMKFIGHVQKVEIGRKNRHVSFLPRFTFPVLPCLYLWQGKAWRRHLAR